MYQECVTCPKIGISCDGPNFMAMSAPDLLSWCKARKNHLHLSNAVLAEMCDMPKGTIDRLFAGEHVDFRYETVRPLVKALVGGDEWSGDPCPDPTDSEKADYENRIKELENEISWRDDKIQHLTDTNESLKTLVANTNVRFTQDKDFLRKQVCNKNRVITILAILLGIFVLAVIAALVVDRLDPSVGFFWLRSFLGGGEETTRVIAKLTP